MNTMLRNTTSVLNNYTMTTPMSGYVFVCSWIRAGLDTRAYEVSAIANDETQVKVGDIILTLDDSMSSFQFNGKSYCRVKTSDIICVLSKKVSHDIVKH